MKPNEQDDEGYLSEDPREEEVEPKQYVSRSGLILLTKEEWERRRKIHSDYWNLLKPEADEDEEEVKRQRREKGIDNEDTYKPTLPRRFSTVPTTHKYIPEYFNEGQTHGYHLYEGPPDLNDLRDEEEFFESRSEEHRANQRT